MARTRHIIMVKSATEIDEIVTHKYTHLVSKVSVPKVTWS